MLHYACPEILLYFALQSGSNNKPNDPFWLRFCSEMSRFMQGRKWKIVWALHLNQAYNLMKPQFSMKSQSISGIRAILILFFFFNWAFLLSGPAWFILMPYFSSLLSCWGRHHMDRIKTRRWLLTAVDSNSCAMMAQVYNCHNNFGTAITMSMKSPPVSS